MVTLNTQLRDDRRGILFFYHILSKIVIIYDIDVLLFRVFYMLLVDEIFM